jgi:hypothetical protein
MNRGKVKAVVSFAIIVPLIVVLVGDSIGSDIRRDTHFVNSVALFN